MFQFALESITLNLIRGGEFAQNRIMPAVNTITIVEERPDSDDGVKLLSELDADLQRHPYPPESRHAFSIERLLRERVAFFVTRYQGEPAACGGVKVFDDYAEIKRMYVRPQHRGRGLAKATLDHLSRYAQSQRVNVLRLETGIYQIEAVGFYERYGFQKRAPFGEYREDPLSVYFEKRI